MPVIEFEGKTTEEALEKARAQLHIPSDELKFEIVSTGSSGIFGLGGKKARIKVTVEERISSQPSQEQKQDEPPRRTEPRRDQAEPPRRQRPAPRPHRSESSSQSRDSRPPREERPRPERPRPAPRREPKKIDSFEDGGAPAVERAFETPAVSSTAPLPPTQAGPGETVYEGPEDEVMTKARESLIGILNRMSLVAEVTVQRISDRIILTISGENSGLLIGKKGATLDALQFLVNKIVNRDNEEKNRVIVDSENYRLRRHQSLVDLAIRMAEKAQRNRRPVTISQLSAHDRRVVHLALQEKTGLRTRSRGDGPLKNVVIIPGAKKSGRPPQARKGHSADTLNEPGGANSETDNEAFESQHE